MSFVYQYSLIYLSKLFEKPATLYPYISCQPNFEMKFDNTTIVINTYKDYLRSFCGIALAHGITPILAPILFKRDLVKKPANVINWDKEKFIDLLEMNCQATRHVAKKIDGVLLLELPPIGKEGFRSSDWIHFSKFGLTKTGENAARELLNCINQA